MPRKARRGIRGRRVRAQNTVRCEDRALASESEGTVLEQLLTLPPIHHGDAVFLPSEIPLTALNTVLSTLDPLPCSLKPLDLGDDQPSATGNEHNASVPDNCDGSETNNNSMQKSTQNMCDPTVSDLCSDAAVRKLFAKIDRTDGDPNNYDNGSWLHKLLLLSVCSLLLLLLLRLEGILDVVVAAPRKSPRRRLEPVRRRLFASALDLSNELARAA